MWRWGKQVQVGLGGPGDACWFGILAARAWGLHVHDARWLVTVSEIRLGFCYLGSGGGGEEGVAGNLHAECGKRSKVCCKTGRVPETPRFSLPSLSHTLAWSRSRFPSLQRAPCARSASDVDCDCDVSVVVVFIYFCFFFYVYKISSLSVSGFRLYCGGCAAAEATAPTMTTTTTKTAMTTPAITYMSWRYHLSGSIFNPRVTSNGRQTVPYDPHDPLPKYPWSASSLLLPLFFFWFIFVASSRNCASISIITDKPIDRQSATAYRCYCSCFFSCATKIEAKASTNTRVNFPQLELELLQSSRHGKDSPSYSRHIALPLLLLSGANSLQGLRSEWGESQTQPRQIFQFNIHCCGLSRGGEGDGGTLRAAGGSFL